MPASLLTGSGCCHSRSFGNFTQNDAAHHYLVFITQRVMDVNKIMIVTLNE